MFSLFKKHQYISRAIVGLVLALTLIAPLGAPVMALAEETTAATNVPATQPPGLDFGCSPLSLGGCIPAAAWGVMTITARIATLTSYALNYAMQKLVVGMGPLVNGMNGINIAWRTVRDLVNVMLVFLTIFIGIATIIGISGYGYKQLLWKVILASLFVNFSITFTKFIIDVSNIFAIETYKEILTAGQEAGGSNPVTCTTIPRDPLPGGETIPEECMNKGIAGTFFNEMKLTTLYSKEALGTTEETITDTKARSRFFWIAIFGSVFLLIAAFVFGAAAFFIIVRLAILIMLIILSPIGLVAWITGVSGIGREWWHKLLNQSFFLPIMMIFWLISLRVMQGMNTSLGSGSGFVQSASVIADGAQAPSASNLEGALAIIVYFFIISAFLIASLVAAKNLGAYGATAAINTGKSWSRKAGMAVGAGAGAATLGTSAWAMRKGIGSNADRLANSETLKNAVNSNNFFKRNIARGVRNVSKSTSERSFDARALAGKNAQQWVGKAQKGGFVEDRKQREKKLKEEAEWTGKASATSEEVRQRDSEIQKVEEKYDEIKNTDVYAKAEQERLNTHDEIQSTQSKLDAAQQAGDNATVTRLTVALETLTQKSYKLDQLKSDMDTERTLKHEILTKRTVGADGKERALTDDEIRQKKEQQENVTKNVSAGLGSVDASVADLDDKIGKGTAAGADKKMLDAWKKERETITKFHEKNREFADLSTRVSVEEADKMAIELQRATDDVNKLKASESRAVDDKLSRTVKARGDARKDTYINVQSTRREGLTEVPNDRDRAYLMTLRQPQGKDKQYADMEKLFEEWEKNKNSTASAPADEATTTSAPTTA